MNLFYRLIAILSLVMCSAVWAEAGSTDPAGIDPDEIIRQCVAKETQFHEVWAKYTYTQQIRFQVLDRNGDPREQRDLTIDVYFTTDGQRKTRIVSDQGEIVSVGITKEDLTDATGMEPFVLTDKELPKYKIEYVGRERVDELDTYVFEVDPRKIESGRRYFRGRIWVDDVDLQIVMTRGKIEPDLGNNKFPRFETVRQQIDGKYWFPTWTKADDVLTFGSHFGIGGVFGGGGGYNRVHVRQYINYTNYKKFEVGASIKYGDVEKAEPNP